MDKYPCNDCDSGWENDSVDSNGGHCFSSCVDNCEILQKWRNENLKEARDILKPIIDRNLDRFSSAWKKLAGR